MDLTEEYCATARRLNQLAGLDDRISLRQGDVTDLPFEDATFTLIISQHVQMNVADKALLYAEARRVLVDSGRLALWDIVASEDGKPDIPLPWADRPEYSHLTTSDRLRTTIETSGFEIEQWNDLTVAEWPGLSLRSDTLIPHNRMNVGMPDRHPGPASGCGGCFT